MNGSFCPASILWILIKIHCIVFGSNLRYNILLVRDLGHKKIPGLNLRSAWSFLLPMAWRSNLITKFTKEGKTSIHEDWHDRHDYWLKQAGPCWVRKFQPRITYPIVNVLYRARGNFLIALVDDGVAGHEAIELAQSREGCHVTDHHSMPETLPDAYDCPSWASDVTGPFKYLARCGAVAGLRS